MASTTQKHIGASPSSKSTSADNCVCTRVIADLQTQLSTLPLSIRVYTSSHATNRLSRYLMQLTFPKKVAAFTPLHESVLS